MNSRPILFSANRPRQPLLPSGGGSRALTTPRRSLRDVMSHPRGNGNNAPADLFIDVDFEDSPQRPKNSLLDKWRSKGANQTRAKEQKNATGNILDGLKAIHELLHHLHQPYFPTGETRMDLLKIINALEEEVRDAGGTVPMPNDFLQLFPPGSPERKLASKFLTEATNRRQIGLNHFYLVDEEADRHFAPEYRVLKSSKDGGSGIALSPFGRLFLEWPEELGPGKIIRGHEEEKEGTPLLPTISKYMTLLLRFMDLARQLEYENRHGELKTPAVTHQPDEGDEDETGSGQYLIARSTTDVSTRTRRTR